jgi:hypothetical protein
VQEGSALSTFNPFITVMELRGLLEDTRLHSTDLIVTRTLGQTGNLGIQRDGVQVGRIEVSPATGMPSHIKWYSTEDK